MVVRLYDHKNQREIVVKDYEVNIIMSRNPSIRFLPDEVYTLQDPLRNRTIQAYGREAEGLLSSGYRVGDRYASPQDFGQTGLEIGEPVSEALLKQNQDSSTEDLIFGRRSPQEDQDPTGAWIGERFSQGFRNWFLFGVPGAVYERGLGTVERGKQVTEEGGFAYGAGAVTGAIGDILAGAKGVGIISKLAARASPKTAKALSTIFRGPQSRGGVIERGVRATGRVGTTATKLAIGGGLYGAADASLRNVGNYLRDQDPHDVSEHVTWGAAFGAGLGVAGKAIGAGARALGWGTKFAFEGSTGITKRNMMKKLNIDSDKANEYLIAAKAVIDKGIAQGKYASGFKLGTKESRQMVKEQLRRDLDEVGRGLGYNRAQADLYRKVMAETVDSDLIITRQKTAQQYLQAFETSFEVMAKLDNAYKLGLSRYPFFREINKRFKQINEKDILTKKFDINKYKSQIKEYRSVLEKIKVKLNPRKKVDKEILKEIEDGMNTIDKYLKGDPSLVNKVRVSTIVKSIDKKTKNKVLKDFEGKATTNLSKKQQKILDIYSYSKTADEFVTDIKRYIKLQGIKFSDYKKAFQGTHLEQVADDSVNASEFVNNLKKMFNTYQDDVASIANKNVIWGQLSNRGFSQTERAQGLTLDVLKKTQPQVYKALIAAQEMLKASKTGSLKHESLYKLRDTVSQIWQPIRRSEMKANTAEGRKLADMYHYLTNLENKFANAEFAFGSRHLPKVYLGGRAEESMYPIGFGAFKKLKDQYSMLQRMQASILKSESEGVQDMGRVILGQTLGQVGAGVAGGAIGFTTGGPATALMGAIVGYAGAKAAPKIGQVIQDQAYFTARPFFNNIINNLNTTDTVLKSDFLSRALKQGTAKIGIEASHTAIIRDIFNMTPNEKVNISNVNKRIDEGLSTQKGREDMMGYKYDYLSGNDLTEAATLHYMKKVQIYSTLKDFMPARNFDFYERDKIKYTKKEERDFSRLLKIVSNPLRVVTKIADGTLTSLEVQVLKQAYPTIYMRIMQAFSLYLQEGGKMSRNQQLALDRLMERVRFPMKTQTDLSEADRGDIMAKRASTGLGKQHERELDRVQIL